MRLGTFSNNGLGFGIAFSLVDDFTLTSRRIEREMGRLAGASVALGAAVESSMARAKAGATGLLVAMVGLFGWAQAAKQDAIFQNFELAFRSFLSSAEEAHRVFEQIKAQAIANPKFSIESMEKANLLLISQGLNADKSMEAIKDLTTVLLGVGRGEAELNRVALAFEKIQAAGFLTGPQFRSLTTAGLPVVSMLKEIGINLNPSKIAKAQITFEQLTQALHASVQAGGQFGRVWEMLNDNVSAMAAQIKENFAATLGDIGKAIRPVTSFILKSVGSILNALREFAATDFGKWTFRFLLALNLILFAFSGLLVVTALASRSLYFLAGAFGASTKSSILAAIATKGTAAGYAVLGRAAMSAAASLLPLIVRLGLFYAGYKIITETDNGWFYAFGTALMFAMGPLGAIAAAFMFVSRSLREFDAVANGTKGVVGGFIGFLQRLGGTIRFIGEAWAGFNAQTGEIEISERLLLAMDRMGIGEFARKMATWIGRIHSAWDGLVIGFTEAWDFFKKAILGIVNAFRPLNAQFLSWDEFLTKNSDNLNEWKERGRIAGIILFTAITALTIAVTTLALTTAATAIAGAVSWLMWAAPLLPIIALVVLLGVVVGDIATALFGTEEMATESFGGIAKAGTSALTDLGLLAPGFNEVGKSWGENLVGGMRTAMGDWWERFAYIDIPTWWKGKDSYYHYVPGSTGPGGRSGYRDLKETANKEIMGSTNSRVAASVVMNNGLTPFSGMASIMQMQGMLAQQYMAFANKGQGAKPAPQKPIVVNLQLDGKQIAQAVVDTNNYKAATQYRDTTYHNNMYDASVDAQSNGLP